jgi:hypothetical protein
VKQSVLSWEDLREVPARDYEVFEPLVAKRSEDIQLRAAHNTIHFYTWGEKECCLERGSTSATLLDSWVGANHSPADQNSYAEKEKKKRALQLAAGDVLIFEEVLGPKTGLSADADPARRHAVRLTRVTRGEDPVVVTDDGQPTPYVEIEWAPADALPFTFCISAMGAAPDCRYLDNLSVARGNVILVDHGKTQGTEDLGRVPTLRTDAECECAGTSGDIRIIPGRFGAKLQKTPLTFRQPLPADGPTTSSWTPAASLLDQEVRLALPQVWLASQPDKPWQTRYDLIAGGADDWQYVVEIDNDGVAHLRFGDGELGAQPPAGMEFTATYRVGNGTAGNVGAESISRLVLKNTRLSGVSVTVRNPLPARGGVEAEPIAEAKLYAPHTFRKHIQRAVIAEDYEEIAERNQKVQQASAALTWTGSWYKAEVAIDPVGRQPADEGLLADIKDHLELFRRIGHDVSVQPARYVPLEVKLEVCAQPTYERAHVKAALLDVFSARVLPGGKRGFFHSDNLTFGAGIYLSELIAAAQAVRGVESVAVTRFQRLFAAPNHELENGVLPLRVTEIAQLDNDPSFPERGKLEIQVRGGR